MLLRSRSSITAPKLCFSLTVLAISLTVKVCSGTRTPGDMLESRRVGVLSPITFRRGTLLREVLNRKSESSSGVKLKPEVMYGVSIMVKMLNYIYLFVSPNRESIPFSPSRKCQTPISPFEALSNTSHRGWLRIGVSSVAHLRSMRGKTRRVMMEAPLARALSYRHTFTRPSTDPRVLTVFGRYLDMIAFN